MVNIRASTTSTTSTIGSGHVTPPLHPNQHLRPQLASHFSTNTTHVFPAPCQLQCVCSQQPISSEANACSKTSDICPDCINLHHDFPNMHEENKMKRESPQSWWHVMFLFGRAATEWPSPQSGGGTCADNNTDVTSTPLFSVCKSEEVPNLNSSQSAPQKLLPTLVGKMVLDQHVHHANSSGIRIAPHACAASTHSKKNEYTTSQLNNKRGSGPELMRPPCRFSQATKVESHG